MDPPPWYPALVRRRRVEPGQREPGSSWLLGCLRLTVVVLLAVATVGCTGQPPATTSSGEPSLGIQIPVPQPFRVAAGEGSAWVLSRGPMPCSPAQPCTVSRIDPGSNRLVGTPTRLPADGWDLAVGAGSVWATQFDGRLVRIDARTGRIRARISARPIYFGSVVTFGGGFVWTGNDDERNHSGSVSKIDPATNHVVGNLAGLGSPQSIAFGQGAVWVADHAGWLVKIDPARLTVLARRRLDFGPHGVVVTPRAVYVADAHGGRLLQVDPETAKVQRVVELSPGPITPVVGAGWIWSSSAEAWGGTTKDNRVLRIDPVTLRIVQVLQLGGNVPSVGFGFGSVWVPVGTRSVVVRIAPTARNGSPPDPRSEEPP
jgi:DNA-binding beta-propeller fold protein YncE